MRHMQTGLTGNRSNNNRRKSPNPDSRTYNRILFRSDDSPAWGPGTFPILCGYSLESSSKCVRAPPQWLSLCSCPRAALSLLPGWLCIRVLRRRNCCSSFHQQCLWFIYVFLLSCWSQHNAWCGMQWCSSVVKNHTGERKWIVVFLIFLSWWRTQSWRAGIFEWSCFEFNFFL